MSEFDRAMRNIDEAAGGRGEGRPGEAGGEPARRIVVDKRTHRVRLENETESEVTVVIEERGSRQ